MTLRNTLKLFEKFAKDHAQINDFGKGPTDELGTKKEQRYPEMWVSLLPSSYGDKALNRQLAIIFYDRILENKSNEVDVQSDMELVALDFMSEFRDNANFDFYFNGNPTINYFTGQYPDWCSGVELTITLKDPKPLDTCEIPLDRYGS